MGGGERGAGIMSIRSKAHVTSTLACVSITEEPKKYNPKSVHVSSKGYFLDMRTSPPPTHSR